MKAVLLSRALSACARRAPRPCARSAQHMRPTRLPLRSCITALVAAVTLLLPVSLIAQENEVDGDSLEITVTATRIERASSLVPASVRVIDRDEIERSGAANLVELLPRVPGVRFTSQSGAIQNSGISMAGFGQSGVLILVNGRPVNPPDMSGVDWTAIPIGNVDRVEVLRGPAASQYGDRAIGGVVNIITNEAPEYTVEISTSVDTLLSNRQAASVGYADDLLDGKITVLRTQELPSREQSDSSSLGGGLNMTVRPGDAWAISLSGNVVRSEYELPGAISREQFEDDPDQINDDESNVTVTEFDLGLEPRYEEGGVDIRLPLSYSQRFTEVENFQGSTFDDRSIQTYDARPQANVALPSFGVARPQLTAGLDTRFQSLGYLDYENEDRDEVDGEANIARTSFAPWLRSTTELSERVAVDGGIRMEFTSLTAESDDLDSDESDSVSPLVYDIGLSWFPTSMLSFDARYARVFRYPSFDEQVIYLDNPDFFLSAGFNNDLQPEDGHHITTGAELTVPDVASGQLVVALNPYAVFMTDEIAFDSDSDSQNSNIDSSRRLGGTAEANYSTEQFSVGLGYSYTRAEVTSGDNEGNIIPRVPTHSGTADVTVQLPAGVALGSDVKATGEFYQDDANDQDLVPGRVDWRAQLSWEPAFVDGLRTYIAAKNILDDRTPTATFGDAAWYPTPGRRFEIGARWRR